MWRSAVLTTASNMPAAGLAVITVMLLTTFLVSLVMVMCWELNPLLVGSFWLLMTFIESAIWSSSLAKVRPHRSHHGMC